MFRDSGQHNQYGNQERRHDKQQDQLIRDQIAFQKRNIEPIAQNGKKHEKEKE